MTHPDIPLLISTSNISTEVNNTGFWRYVRPAFVQKTAPCSAACPAGEDIARVEKLVRQGFYKRALECILVENPFPGVCGRVCFHPCESACNRKSYDEAVSIRCIERFLGDGAVANRFDPVVFRFPPNKKKSPLSGPARLDCPQRIFCPSWDMPAPYLNPRAKQAVFFGGEFRLTACRWMFWNSRSTGSGSRGCDSVQFACIGKCIGGDGRRV